MVVHVRLILKESEIALMIVCVFRGSELCIISFPFFCCASHKLEGCGTGNEELVVIVLLNFTHKLTHNFDMMEGSSELLFSKVCALFIPFGWLLKCL